MAQFLKLGLEELVNELCTKDDGVQGAMTDWINLKVGGTLFENGDERGSWAI